MKNGKPIAYGVNQTRYSKNLSTFKCSFHAEMMLLKKLGSKAKGSKFFVFRFNNTSHNDARKVKNAKPCLCCQHVLKKAGVSKVTYVDSNGEVQTLHNRDMKSLNGEPHYLTYSFLEENGDKQHGPFNFKKHAI